MHRRALAAVLAWFGLGAMQGPQTLPVAPPAEISLWRLDCGEFVINQTGAFFSDTFQYPPGSKTISAAAT